MRRNLLLTAVLVLALTACHSPEKPPPVAAPPVRVSAPAPASAAPSSTPSPSASSGGSCAARTLAAMSPEQRAGQLLMIGTPVGEPRPLAAAVTRYHLGGVFLAGRSKRPATALRADIAALQGAAGTPLLVALDQEGGDVQTLQGNDFPPSRPRCGWAAAPRPRCAPRPATPPGGSPPSA